MIALTEETDLAPLRFAVHLTAQGDLTSGTFVATGLVSDSGTLPLLERFSALGCEVRVPIVVRGAETLAGAAGAIALAYDGIFRPATVGILAGQGAWRVVGGDHSYSALTGEGAWTATAITGDASLVLDAVFDGEGSIG